MKLRASFLAACLSFLPVSGFGGGAVESTPEIVDAGRCGGHSYYTRRFSPQIMNLPNQPKFEASLQVSVRNPSSSAGVASTVVYARFRTKNILGSLGTLYSGFNSNGCDRLNYNNDASSAISDGNFVLSGSLTYEERICLGGPSTTVATTTRAAQFIISPQFGLKSDSDGQTKLLIETSGKFFLPVFIFAIEREFFDLSFDDIELPDIVSAQIDHTNQSLSIVGGGDLLYEAELHFRELPLALSCLFKKEIGSALWETKEFARSY